MAANDDEERAAEEWSKLKSSLMERALGPVHDRVMHSPIPLVLGGSLDLFYYPNGIPGAGVATQELSDLLDESPANDLLNRYELVMFTRHKLNLDEADNDSTPFGRAHRIINEALNYIAMYAMQARLNPTETCEFPDDMGLLSEKCFIFAAYAGYRLRDGQTFGLMTPIEIYRSEMQFAQQNGGAEMLRLLKKAGHYPYSDLDREPVV